MGRCQKEFFNSIDGVRFSTINLQAFLTAKGGGGFDYTLQQDKPFIPLWAIITDASGALKPDSVANHKTFKDTFLTMAAQFYAASSNAANNLTGVPYAQYLAPWPAGNPNYDQYLYQKVVAYASNYANYASYWNAPNIVWNFWNNIDAAITNNDLIPKLQSLVKQITLSQDGRFFIPPGSYKFNNTNALETAVAAWKTAQASLYGWFCVQLDSIG